MFGFGRQKDLKTAIPIAAQGFVRPAAASRPVVLVSREDIYAGDPEQPILLARKGTEVDPETLPKFIRNGAKPSQFQVKQDLNPAAAYQTNPITCDPADVTRSQKNVIVLDPDQKSLKRLIDCLFVCGFSLNRIHPVRVPGHLSWTLSKYRPQVLIVDYDLRNGLTGLGLIQEMKPQASIEKIILTLDDPEQLTPSEQKWINRICAEQHIEILLKPVNRHTLNTLLDSI